MFESEESILQATVHEVDQGAHSPGIFLGV